MNPWHRSSQTWNAYGLTWEFTYSELNAKRTITATGFSLDVPIFDTSKFPSPQAWHSAWARKNKKRLPSLVQERAVTPELDFSPKNEPLPEAVEVEVVP